MDGVRRDAGRVMPPEPDGTAIRRSAKLPKFYRRVTTADGGAVNLLPMRRAFVVQVARESNLPHGKVAGRVEHVDSGRARNFRSLDELLNFLCEALTAEQQAEDAEGREGGHS
jgi:hypothetical protein